MKTLLYGIVFFFGSMLVHPPLGLGVLWLLLQPMVWFFAPYALGVPVGLVFWNFSWAWIFFPRIIEFPYTLKGRWLKLLSMIKLFLFFFLFGLSDFVSCFIGLLNSICIELEFKNKDYFCFEQLNSVGNSKIKVQNFSTLKISFMTKISFGVFCLWNDRRLITCFRLRGRSVNTKRCFNAGGCFARLFF